MPAEITLDNVRGELFNQKVAEFEQCQVDGIDYAVKMPTIRDLYEIHKIIKEVEGFSYNLIFQTWMLIKATYMTDKKTPVFQEADYDTILNSTVKSHIYELALNVARLTASNDVDLKKT